MDKVKEKETASVLPTVAQLATDHQSALILVYSRMWRHATSYRYIRLHEVTVFWRGSLTPSTKL